ncbi:efflux RND transporter permease subunit [Brachyspira hyodysenteriae]|uniref:efflux RND transporter permease subunit n=1 Tax=Brachyspira hyodysenteriae TaxID=159 RepID=UPI00063DA8B7|nr:efflux RND transporter permease subunit [Brachyspira hyodysenteriae]KLI19986.1 multidrug transporter [Brachyspira hyodysenteriae]KLI30636.1 multidrug transporter [Brachyspira hyodysenteriae]KLI39363.1 multidrug transporter [Brachyspira hyodysenteriae]KLI46850.1 multidrug transporter [Brachyspira hyodysenteriae]MCZ9886427.1 efflux RND transporter permease subunit [Brachyspira hyodysenteriae]
MRNFIELVVKRPVAVFMCMIAVLILGFVSLSKLAVDFLPDMELPYITVSTEYENAGPEEVEKSVTRIVENAVATVSDINTITSTSEEGKSSVFIEFNWGTDLAVATADVREAIDGIKNSLPDDADSPTVLKFSTDMTPIMEIAFFGTDNLGALYTLIDNQILNKIEQASGVARAEIRGGLKTEMKVDLVLNRLHAYGIDINSIVSLLSSENQNLSGGDTYEGVYKYTLRTMGEFTTPEDIENTVVALKTNDTPIKLKDIGRVYQGYSDDSEIVKINGMPAISVSVNKESGGNSVNVSKAVKRQLANLNLPEGVEYEILFNSADNVNEAINGVLDTAWQGGLFAVIILMLYLWNVKTVSIIAVSIPISIIITFTLMYFMGITLNIISLSGLVLGIGMMVDNSIVVLENIFYYRNNGYGKYSSAINGTSTVALAISASTLTTIAVFLPFLFVEGQTGQLFRDLCITVTVSMIGSLFVALTIVPMLGARLVTNKKTKFLIPIENFVNDKFHSKINNLYSNLLSYSIKNKKKVFISSLSVVFVIIILGLIFIGKEGFPTSDEGQFKIEVKMPVGTKSEQTQAFITRMEGDIQDAIGEDFDRMQSRVKSGSEENAAEIRVQLREKSEGRKLSVDEYIEITRNALVSYPAQINISAITTSAIGGGGRDGGTGGQEIEIELVGDDLDKSTEIANNIINAISSIEGIREPRLTRDDSNPELKIYVNREIAAKMGINVNTIANIIKTSFAGTTATTMTPANSDVTDIDVNVQLGEPDRLKIDDISRLMIPTTAGIVPISSIATVEKSYGPTEIERKDSTRITTIKASAYNRALSEIMQDVQENISSKVFLPSGFTINYAGDFEDMKEAFLQLIQAFILALVLVYAIMASQFESFIAPFVIALAIPFGFAGSLLALFIGRQTLSVYSGIGFIVLIGIVVNNGIVLIDYMNQLMHEKNINGDEAALESGPRRLRPVLMTTLTTILGLLPMALSGGSGNEMYQPLSIAILGGLLVSTAFTLIIVPTVYAAIRNKIPLKDYEKKDLESKNDFSNYDTINVTGK